MTKLMILRQSVHTATDYTERKAFCDALPWLSRRLRYTASKMLSVAELLTLEAFTPLLQRANAARTLMYCRLAFSELVNAVSA